MNAVYFRHSCSSTYIKQKIIKVQIWLNMRFFLHAVSNNVATAYKHLEHLPQIALWYWSSTRSKFTHEFRMNRNSYNETITAVFFSFLKHKYTKLYSIDIHIFTQYWILQPFTGLCLQLKAGLLPLKYVLCNDKNKCCEKQHRNIYTTTMLK